MELKDYKYIRNTKRLPGFANGVIPVVNFGQNPQPVAPNIIFNNWPRTPIGIDTRDFGAEANNYLRSQRKENTSMLSAGAQAIPAAVGAAGDIIQAHRYEKTVDDLSAEAGYSQSSVGGIGYSYQNTIDKNKEMQNVKRQNTANTLKSTASGAAAGAALGNVVPGIGTVAGGLVGGVVGLVGGLFGSKSRKKKAQKAIQEQQQRAYDYNQWNRSGALTTKLQLDEQESIGYADGKDPLVDTSLGLMQAEPNARTSEGEWIVNYITGNAHKVNRGKNDSAPSFLLPQDAVLSRKNGGAQYFEQTGDLEGALYIDNVNRGYNKYKEGKQPLPRFKNGMPGYWIPGLFGAVGSLYQYFDAANQGVKKPNTYRKNNYQNRALNILGGLNVNRLQILRQMRDAEARGAQSINLSGATPSQKYMARVAQAANTQTAIGDIMAKLNEQQNALKSQYASSLLSTGQADRDAAMNSARWDLDYYSKAHAAKQQGQQMGLYNFLNNLNQTYANAFKYNTYNRMYNLYNTELDEEARRAYANLVLSNN